MRVVLTVPELPEVETLRRGLSSGRATNFCPHCQRRRDDSGV